MKCKSWLAVLILVVLCVPLADLQAQAPASTSAAAPAAQGRKKRVAVFDFDYATVQSYSSAAFGTNVDVGRGIADLTVKYLVQDGTYSVIERQAMDKILREQNFSNSDRADPNSAAKIGKLLGVDAIIVGSVTQFGNETKNTGVGGSGGGWGGYGLGGFKHKDSKAIVAVDARIVNIDTAEIMGVAEGKGESSRSSTSLLGGGGNWHGWGGGAVDFGSSDFQQTILGEAVNAAVKQMSGELIADNTKLVARTVNVEGLVAAVDGGQIVLNVGAKAGLKVGDQLTVERVTKEIKDPSTGQVIRRLASPVGVIKLTDVDAISAVGTAVSGSGFKVGDACKTVTQ
ncbi:MAG TPA: CsgG/HfaB family protein [Candidatus Eisenbacteria bacterium]|nr:CsgG/HfaB family protein [Candidatus Eisenbacteria bacterium]